MTRITSSGTPAMHVCPPAGVAGLIGYTLVYKLARHVNPLLFRSYKGLGYEDRCNWDDRSETTRYNDQGKKALLSDDSL